VFASGRFEAVVVFDGGGPDPGAPKGVRVEFSGHGEADTIVEALAFEARDEGRPCVVVTSDRATRDAVLGRGVDVISSAKMLEHLDESATEWRESSGRSHRVTIAQMLDPETRAALEARVKGRPGE
jgi:predicted RNA-binding protein with PIN domain